jgi:transketolase
MASTDHPTTIITSRGNVKQYPSSIDEAKCGAYIIHPRKNHDMNIIATGSEVPLAIDVSNILLSDAKIKARVISMPSIELFETQGNNYKKSILDDKPTASIEFSATAP